LFLSNSDKFHFQLLIVVFLGAKGQELRRYV